jgi:cholesterol transport system auxiliary component
MSMQSRRRRALITASTAAAALLLSGCVGLGGRVPDSLLTLSAENSLSATSTRQGAVATSLTVLVPTVPQKLRTPRIPVEVTSTTIAYVPDAQWVEAPARLFQRLLSETVAANTNRLVLDESQYITGPGELLAGELLDFGIEAGTNEAVVTYQALRLTGNGETVSQRRFQTRQLVGEVNAANVGMALNRAANQVAIDVASWVGG